MPARIFPNELSRFLPESGLCWISACSAESEAFREGLRGVSRPGLTFTTIFVPGLNRPSYLLDTGAQIVSFFMLPEFAAHPQVTFLPLPYREISQWLVQNPPSVAMLMVSPPDENGMCSLGAVTDFASDIWQGCKTIIAHINPSMPATQGSNSIPIERFAAVIEAPQALPSQDPGSDSQAEEIARFAAQIIPDGATLQAGLGRIPETILRGLTAKRDLAVHSGLIGDSTLHLLNAGALRATDPITAGVAIGTEQLYSALTHPAFQFFPPSITHDLSVLARLKGFVTINSAIEVDLEGQVRAEETPKGAISGPGGASDFAAGARAPGGLRIIALPATAARGSISRIVRPEEATGPISLGRFDSDIIITEFGCADLRMKSPEGRRNALIAIAAPQYRAALNK